MTEKILSKERKERESFIGCTKCYRKKRDCKCSFGDFHRIQERRFDFWKFELVRNACGKKVMTERQGRDDAKYCGDVLFSDIFLCDKCEEIDKTFKENIGDLAE